MVANCQYTISALLKKIARDMHIYDRTDSISMPYGTFRAIMMKEDFVPIMTYERTIKEKYHLLCDLKFIVKTLDDEKPIVLNTSRIIEYLEGLE